MSRLVSRILLSIFMFPLAGLFFIFSIIVAKSATPIGALYSDLRELITFLICGAMTWLLIAIYWCLLWKSSVQWNPKRIKGTIAAAGGAILVGAAAGALASGALRVGDSESVGAFVGSILTIVVWLIATVFVWRETPMERAARIKSSGRSGVACPNCGYNMTGLTEPRCPECGSKFTLDELLAAQQAETGDVE